MYAPFFSGRGMIPFCTGRQSASPPFHTPASIVNGRSSNWRCNFAPGATGWGFMFFTSSGGAAASATTPRPPVDHVYVPRRWSIVSPSTANRKSGGWMSPDWQPDSHTAMRSHSHLFFMSFSPFSVRRFACSFVSLSIVILGKIRNGKAISKGGEWNERAN